MSLTQEIREAIEKNLPSQTAGVLKEYILKMELLEQENKTLTRVREDQEDAIRQLRKDYGALSFENSKLESKVKEFEAREDYIKDAEQKILIANLQKDKSDGIAIAVTSIVEKVFSNRHFRYTEIINGSTSGFNPANGMSQGTSKITQKTVEGED